MAAPVKGLTTGTTTSPRTAATAALIANPAMATARAPALGQVDLTGDPRDALTRPIESSWHLVDRYRSLLIAAQDTLPPGRVRELHADPMARVERLIECGRKQVRSAPTCPRAGWSA